MKIHSFHAAVLAVAVVSLSLFNVSRAEENATPAPPKVIYGDDDRLDLYQVQDANLRKLADSTVALFKDSRVRRTFFGFGPSAKLKTRDYGRERNLCATERFYDQGFGAFCSGSLVGPDLILTAGHCVEDAEDCGETKFVFGFAVHEAGKSPKKVKARDVYSCKRIVGRAQATNGADWAVVQLDRVVKGHAPLAINRSAEKVAEGTPLVVIGHPSGLPTKVAGGAVVRDSSKDSYFVANTDTYGGNSGSAVFNARTGLVEGILVRGEQDFDRSPAGCVESVRCSNGDCRGEDVTRVSEASRLIPAL